ncbi:hypothetical protein AU476_20865 [Cupriavidus sp. UYMSc13B]|nr:hypothetical protein AU476_20865 [Cupriavidus sp. UYMSc13B]
MTDSLLSYAGVRDERTGQQWGGVMNSSARADVGWDDGLFGIYGYGGYGLLTGHDVKRNTRWEGGGGFYLRVIDTPDQRLLSGVNFTSMGYAENLRYFTFGQGGYFSPQTYFAVTVPLSLSGRSGRLAYNVRGALGVQAFSEDDSNYFPTDAAAQSAANAAVATANSKGLTNATSAVYPASPRPAWPTTWSARSNTRRRSNSMWAAWWASTTRATIANGMPASTCVMRCSARPD